VGHYLLLVGEQRCRHRLAASRTAHDEPVTIDLDTVRVLLGHSNIGSTARYLEDVKQPDPLAVSRAHEI